MIQIWIRGEVEMHIDEAYFYAGIGSRETPSHIIEIMNYLGCYLCEKGWILRSGGALGADKAFEQAADFIVNKGRNLNDNYKEIYLPWEGYNNSKSEINPSNYPFTQMEDEFAARFHPAWEKCSPSVRLLHKRNTRVLLGLKQLHGEHVRPVRFIVCWTPHGLATGGTGQALRIAKGCQIPVFNLGSATNIDELQNLVLMIDAFQEKSYKQNQIKEN
jgi:hypothetical protein